jgi:hypothetical protein
LICNRLLPFVDGKSAELAGGWAGDAESLLVLAFPQADTASASATGIVAAAMRRGFMAAKGREGACTRE